MKSPFNKLLAALAITILAATAFDNVSAARATQASGKLHGIVVDWQYARISNTKIFFDGASGTRRVVVNEEGGYEVELPAGTYLVRAVSQGFRVRRFKFNVKPGSTRELNLILDVEQTKPFKCPKGKICVQL